MYLQYQSEPTDAELEAIGMRRSDYEDEEPEILHFDDNMMKAWDIYCSMATQWRVGANGATGLDYNVLNFLFRVYNVSEEELVLSDLRILEAKALEMMDNLRKK
ncbi:hypothetical protein [Escherichia phage vB_EcoS_SCS31]|uniref:Tape measure chaperone n=1 Tax=Escherichia phage vB_EcoS_SCS31 TaxID=2932865 RepID=A0A9E7A1T1_9CAUD|nr:hypothetical protein [Escherichia phage vB_EcoS_SCS31]